MEIIEIAYQAERGRLSVRLGFFPKTQLQCTTVIG
jgi:hypothetical protein